MQLQHNWDHSLTVNMWEGWMVEGINWDNQLGHGFHSFFPFQLQWWYLKNLTSAVLLSQHPNFNYFLLRSGTVSVRETLCSLEGNRFCLGVFHAPLHKESRWEANSHKTGYSGWKRVCCAHDWTHRAMLSQCQVNLKSCVKKWEILEESNSHITWIDIILCLPSVYSGSILYQLQFLIHIKKAGYVYLQQECPESCLVLIVFYGSYLT